MYIQETLQMWGSSSYSLGEENVSISVKENNIMWKERQFPKIIFEFSIIRFVSLKHHLKYPTHGLLNQSITGLNTFGRLFCQYCSPVLEQLFDFMQHFTGIRWVLISQITVSLKASLAVHPLVRWIYKMLYSTFSVSFDIKLLLREAPKITLVFGKVVSQPKAVKQPHFIRFKHIWHELQTFCIPVRIVYYLNHSNFSNVEWMWAVDS